MQTTLKINQDLLSFSPHTRPGTKRTETLGIVMHYVGNPGTSAKQNRDYFESLGKNGPDASCHYIVGRGGEVLQLVPDDEVSYTSGGASYKPVVIEKLRGNVHLTTIGVEVCHEDETGRYSLATYRAQALLAAMLLNRYGLKAERDLYRHFDITGKVCPRWFVDNPSDWEKFKTLVAIYQKEGVNGL